MFQPPEGSLRVFDFTDAIVRTPGRSVVDGLRDDPNQTPSFDGVLGEHRAYVAALRETGMSVDVLPPLEAFPDSVFVEDPALVIPEGAILLRPGAPSRLAERDELRGALAKHFERLLELGDGEFADGGDVLIAPNTIFIGMSKRTNRAGAEALRAKLAELGRDARIVKTPPGILHFKTACSLLDEDTILTTETMAASGIFAGFDVLLTREGEEAAANALRVNDIVFVGAHYPETVEKLIKHGFSVHPLAISEVAKLDAGLSCMSLRWTKL